MTQANSGNALASYTYTDHDFLLKTLDYGNGNGVQYEYDKQGRVTKETYEDGDTVSYQYDNSGALATVTDSAGNKTTYYYDFTDRLMKYVESGNGHNHTVSYEYDNINNLTRLVQTINGVQSTTSYTYDEDNRITGITTDSASRTYTYDDFGRVTQRVSSLNGSPVLTQSLTYRTVSGQATGQVETLSSPVGNFTYSYDENGNITAINNGRFANYEYDSANQLIRENNAAVRKSWVWEYDDAGNILNKYEYDFTTGELGPVRYTISYGYMDSTWGDLLTSYDGKRLRYDTIGNLLYDDTWHYAWDHGRRLVGMRGNNSTWSFYYDTNGLRTKRTDSSTTYEYFYTGDKLTMMTVNGEQLWFYYDAAGIPYALKYQGNYYYYSTNLQGDVEAIRNTSGTTVVQYTYDAWGNLVRYGGSLFSTLGQINPLRYRGYVYDAETGLYYLQSRYYNPEVGRFINADSYTSTGQGLLGNNMFAYCNNNPVNRHDPSGAVSYIAFGSREDPMQAFMRMLGSSGGGNGGGLLGAIIGGAIAGGTINTISYLASSSINDSEITTEGIIQAAVTGVITGGIAGFAGTGSVNVARVGSALVGIISGTITACGADGTIGQKTVLGIATAAIAGFGTYVGTKMPVVYDNLFTAGFTSFTGALFVGTQAEIINVLTQQAISGMLSHSNDGMYASDSGAILYPIAVF